MGFKVALLAGLASSLWMTGLVAFVQSVHYPLFGRVDVETFARYHAEHVRRTGPLVMLPMVVELGSAVVLALASRSQVGVNAWLVRIGLAAAVLTWVATALLSVPMHNRLASGFDPEAHQRLVLTNWVRLAAWLVHSGTLLALTYRQL